MKHLSHLKYVRKERFLFQVRLIGRGGVRESSGKEDTGNVFSRCLGLIQMVINLNVDYCSSAGGLTQSM